MNFATCNRKRAFGFIRAVYPSYEVTEEDCSDVLDAVEQDLIRIEDPFMYGVQILIVIGNEFDSEKHDAGEIHSHCMKMIEKIKSKPKNKLTENGEKK